MVKRLISYSVSFDFEALTWKYCERDFAILSDHLSCTVLTLQTVQRPWQFLSFFGHKKFTNGRKNSRNGSCKRSGSLNVQERIVAKHSHSRFENAKNTVHSHLFLFSFSLSEWFRLKFIALRFLKKNLN